MAARASALAQGLAEYEDDDVLQALTLLISQRPHLSDAIAEIAQQGPSKRYSGVVSAFYPLKKYGFIKSDEITAEFGADTFLSDKELGLFEVGSAVTFSVAINKNNKPQARLLADAGLEDPLFAIPPPQRTRVPMKRAQDAHPEVAAPAPRKAPRLNQTGGLAGHSMQAPADFGAPKGPSKGKGAAKGKGKDAAKGWIDATAGWVDPSEVRYLGVISAFYPEKKCGFIKSEEVFRQYGVDTFVSQMEIGSFTVDSVVSFRIAENAKGKPQARDLADGAHQQQAEQWSEPQQYVEQWAEPQQQEDPLSVRYIGQIHHFVAERKFGFIGNDELKAAFGVETFLSNKEVLDFKNGDVVSFNISMNAKGQPQAHGLEAAIQM